MDFMTSEALNNLWEAEQRARRHENEYWRVADELLEQGLVRLEDVAAIYGCHPATAAKRLKAWRMRVPARTAQADMRQLLGDIINFPQKFDSA